MLYKLNTMLLLVSLATNVEAVVGGAIVVMKPPSNYSNNSTCLKFDIHHNCVCWAKRGSCIKCRGKLKKDRGV